jgi:tetratricopeptide (TPR) repeat protein
MSYRKKTMRTAYIFSRLTSRIIPATLLLALIALAGCESPEQKVAGFLESARELYAEEELIKAELEVKNALQIQPKNAEANYLLAEISESRQDFPQMAAALRATIDSDPQYVDARVKLGTLYTLAGSTEAAQEQYDALLEMGADSAPVKVLGARLIAFAGDLETARVMLEEALAQDPTNIQALGLLASIAATEDIDSALALLDEGIRSSETTRPLRLLRLQLLTRANRIDAVEAEYEALIGEYPEEVAFGYQYARFLIEQGRIEDVEKVLEQIVEQQPDNSQPKLALVQFVAGTRGQEAAEQILRDYVATDPDALDLRNALARYLQANGRLDEAYAEYEKVSAQAGNDDIGLTARAKMAGIQLARGATDAGLEIIEDVLLTDSLNTEALILRGAVSAEREEYRDAVSDFRNVLRKDPEDRRAQLLLAQTHQRAGDNTLAKDAYRRAIENYPNEGFAYLALARLLAADGNTNNAERVLRDRLNIAPQDTEASRLLISVLKSRGRDQEALNMAQDMAAQPGSEAIGQYLVGTLYFGDEEYDRATEAFRTALDLAPNSREPLQGLVAALVRADRSAEAEAFLADYSEQYPDNLLVKTLLGQLLAGQGESVAARELLESTLESDEAWLPAYTALAGLQGDDVSAQIDIYERGLEAVPDSQELALLLGTALERDGRVEDAIAAYEKALDANENLPAVANNLAALLADYRSDRASFERAYELAAQFEKSDNPAFIDTLGWVYYRLGETQKALPLLEKAVDTAGQIPVLRYHLGMAYYANGQQARAREELEKAISDAGERSFTGIEDARQTLQSLN